MKNEIVEEFEQARDRMLGMNFSATDMDTIFADWPNYFEHLAWLLTATREEIQDWLDSMK